MVINHIKSPKKLVFVSGRDILVIVEGADTVSVSEKIVLPILVAPPNALSTVGRVVSLKSSGFNEESTEPTAPATKQSSPIDNNT